MCGMVIPIVSARSLSYSSSIYTYMTSIVEMERMPEKSDPCKRDSHDLYHQYDKNVHGLN